jgi:hypothetical protein
MDTTYHDTTTHHDEAAIEAYVTAGLEPTDEAPESWLARYEAWATTGDGYVVAHRPDPEAELTLAVLTRSGVIRSEARFDLTDLGLAMFVAAAEVAQS